MTNEEAIKLLKEIHDVDLLNIESWAINPYLQALEVAVSSIEKQIPKKLNRKERHFVRCSCCSMAIELGTPKYCEDCGQALDWSEENANNS